MSQADNSTGTNQVQGPYILARATARPQLGKDPIRGDLAHIALAGKHFVPHYAVPQPRTVMPGGAALHVEPRDDAEELCVLMEGDTFEVLDEVGAWAWGCLSVDGPTGYILADRLEQLG